MVGLEAPPSSLTYEGGVAAVKQSHLPLFKTPSVKEETVWWGSTTGIEGPQADIHNKEGGKKVRK